MYILNVRSQNASCLYSGLFDKCDGEITAVVNEGLICPQGIIKDCF